MGKNIHYLRNIYLPVIAKKSMIKTFIFFPVERKYALKYLHPEESDTTINLVLTLFLYQ